MQKPTASAFTVAEASTIFVINSRRPNRRRRAR